MIELPLDAKPSALIIVLNFIKSQETSLDPKNLTLYNSKHILTIAMFLRMAELERKVLIDIIV